MTFRVPPRTKYSPPNVEQLQRTFERRMNALVGLVRSIAANDRSAKRTTSKASTSVDELQSVIYVQDQYSVSQSHIRAYGYLLSELEKLRRQIQSHPINFVPLDIILLIFSDVAWDEGYYESDSRFALAQVSRSWEAIVLTTPALWARFLFRRYHTNRKTLDIPILLSQQAPLELIGDCYSLKPLQLLLHTDRAVRSIDIVISEEESFAEPVDVAVRYGEDLERLLPKVAVVGISGPDISLVTYSISFIDYMHVFELTIRAGKEVKPTFEHQKLVFLNLRCLKLMYYYTYELLEALSAPLLTSFTFEGCDLIDQHHLHRWLSYFASSLCTLQYLNINLSFTEWTLSRWDFFTPPNVIPSKVFQAAEVEYRRFSLVSSELLPLPLQDDTAHIQEYSFVAGNLTMNFTYLYLELMQEVLPLADSPYFPHLSTLRVASGFPSAIVQLLRRFTAPCLKDLSLDSGRVKRHSYRRFDLESIISVESLQIEGVAVGAVFRLKGIWPNLLSARMSLSSLNWKNDTNQLPQIRSLYFFNENISSQFKYDLTFTRVLDFGSLRYLNLCESLPGLFFPLLTAIEVIEFRVWNSNSHINQLVQLLADDYRHCPLLSSITSSYPPVDWGSLCKVVALRAQAWLLEGSVARMTCLYFDEAPRRSYFQALESAMKGELIPGNYEPLICEECKKSSTDMACRHVLNGSAEFQTV